MITCEELISFLEELAPKELAEDYDNVGLLIGSANKNIERILVCLDTDEWVAEEAAAKRADMVLSHHPLIFKPVRQILTESVFGKTAMTFIQNNITLYAAHTNFDSAHGGLCDYLLTKICECDVLGVLDGADGSGIGRVARLKSAVSMENLMRCIQGALGMKHIRFVGDPQRSIERIAICNGGGGDYVYNAQAAGADVYISGDFKYHHARSAYENGMGLIEIPHYEAEIIFCEYFEKILNEKFGDKITVYRAEQNKNVWNNFEDEGSIKNL